MYLERLREVSQEAWRIVKRPVGCAAAGISSLALSCSPQVPKEGSVYATPTPSPSPFATQQPFEQPTAVSAISTPKPEPTNTPEPLRFANFGIYKGPIDGGGEVLLAAKPDGRMAAAVKRTDTACSNPNIKPLTYFIDFPREDASFAYEAKNASGVVSKRIQGELQNNEIIGHLGNDNYPVQSATGQITCPATSFSYRAVFLGLEKETFIKEYRKMWPEPTNPQLEAIFDRFLGQ